MLRLTPPNYEKIRMASGFEGPATAAARPTLHWHWLTLVWTAPSSAWCPTTVWVRRRALAAFQRRALHPYDLTEPNETPSSRRYLLSETGYGIRPSKVIYDRKHSAITEYDFSQVDLDALLDGYDWLHLSGITPALAPNCRTLILDMLKVAKNKGLTVSFDGNFRSTLWSWEENPRFLHQYLPYVDVLLGTGAITTCGRDESDQRRRLEGRRASAAQL